MSATLDCIDFIMQNSRIIRNDFSEDYEIECEDRWSYAHDCHYTVDSALTHFSSSTMTIRSLVKVDDELIQDYDITDEQKLIETAIDIITNRDWEGVFLPCVNDIFFDKDFLVPDGVDVKGYKFRKVNDTLYLIQVEAVFYSSYSKPL